MVDQALKGLPLLHLTLWLVRDSCCGDKGSVPLSASARVNQMSIIKGCQQCWKEWQVGVFESV